MIPLLQFIFGQITSTIKYYWKKIFYYEDHCHWSRIDFNIEEAQKRLKYHVKVKLSNSVEALNWVKTELKLTEFVQFEWCSPNRFIFCNETDAMAFKLRWS